MTVNFIEYFADKKYENKILFKDSLKSYTVSDVKKFLEKEIQGEDNFSIILKYLKNILQNPNFALDFVTSGTSGNQTHIEKTLENFQEESRDIFSELKLEKGLEFITTTTPEHLFGASFYMMFPLNFDYIINVSRINYPEDLVYKNAVLITTPSFLDTMRKYDIKPPQNPEIIITAGSKLKDETFNYAKTISKRVIEIYGSTEAGIIAYRESPKTNRLKLFSGIKILSSNDNGTEILTKYSKCENQTLNDRIRVLGDEIEFLGRSDRLIKVLEKRISAEDMENEISKNKFVEECFCFEYYGKIACLVALNDLGKEEAKENGTLEISKELKTNLHKLFEIIPQKWAFTDEIPKTERGKVDKTSVENIFDTNITFPLILSRDFENNVCVFELCFLKNSNFFQGHFEGFPILPGVVQLFYANYFTKLAYDIDCRCGQIRKIKFKNIIFPSREVFLELKKKENSVEFKYYNQDKIFSSGILPTISLL